MEHSARLTISGIENIDYIEPDSVTDFSPTENGPCKRFGPRRCHGIVFKVQGDSRYCFGDSVELKVQAGDVIYLPQGLAYSVYSSRNGGLYYANFYSADSRINSPVLLRPSSPHKVSMDFSNLLNCWTRHRAGYLSRCYSILYGFLAELEERQPTQRLRPDREKMLRDLIEELDGMAADAEISVAAMAERCRMSEAYFRRCFQEMCGMPPKQYLTEMRIGKAKTMLEYTDLSVSEIAVRTGYQDIYRMSRAFKSVTGSSPTEYRNLNKQDPGGGNAK